ncbi:hypothetical protein DesLBE_4389 [Desulfitobacterium sp. LBE]|uniref:Uncharacterized protein n=3 Tax=Desulfitobacterium hafniense TaxID=49338 RepID=A0A098B2S4_DESHA|nr:MULTISPECIES: hypothetical protein [Desulfitobacterium]ACL22250.1 hypothetical protein Dhaf_4243 [Desulfitobacterium hafniense DCB-2]EHL04665.1 hypothetical protein HMPREF0322_04756 [Desulfitobacterium hafniense DP7]KTE92071.1 hypothetical protein AT727_03825 [Desulfitobacterium hafniense]TWH59976.1 hypothetical protein DesLBE_4389 [Desulfitobacterium sp. LBE]CDX03184.1 Hypothetical protein DPCES_3297 [Desulfitobacterium hafniense]
MFKLENELLDKLSELLIVNEDLPQYILAGAKGCPCGGSCAGECTGTCEYESLKSSCVLLL